LGPGVLIYVGRAVAGFPAFCTRTALSTDAAELLHGPVFYATGMLWRVEDREPDRDSLWDQRSGRSL